MKTYSISGLAKAFGLSRSTLLYYDRIGLLKAPVRTSAGYRCYTPSEYRRLERISVYRSAGLSLADIRALLADEKSAHVRILEKRLQDLESEVQHIRQQQRQITAMLKTMSSKDYPPVVDKKMWVEMMAAAGMDEAAMEKWHAAFEQRAPDAHEDFLRSLGLGQEEVEKIREWSGKAAKLRIDVPVKSRILRF